MGCISSKQAVPVSPAFDDPVAVEDNVFGNLGSVSRPDRGGLGELEIKKEESVIERGRELGRSKKDSSNGRISFSLRFGGSYKSVEAEQVAAGWPAWLSAIAGEAIHGMVPLRPDSFEKLEKIGQGTYSSVFRARDVKTGRMVALKKVRFDNYQPESIRFMAREITILRRLDHPNIMKLEGLIASRLSCSIYLVFEYMEHDLSGLLSCPDIKFSESQVKCYMQQLLSGIEHCHLRGVMHRDIKASNILVNNEGILKVADFGLANLLSSRHTQPLTSRVVTLWYRPPELLLGSTNYGVSVDLWSVGCLFAELLMGKPILKGRTEVEQLHKIFKLCGSPPEDYWKKSKLPHATMFKPQYQYESSLRDKCKEFPTTAVKLIETFLSIEPHKRGTISSALTSEYFTTKPYPCEPSSLPKYPPTKEIDAKSREEAQRNRSAVRVRGSGTSRKPRRVTSTVSNLAPTVGVQANTQFARRNNGGNAHMPKGKGDAERREPLQSSFDTMSEVSQLPNTSEGDILFSGPLQVTASSGFAWAKRRKEEAAPMRSYSSASSRSQTFSSLDPLSVLHAKHILNSKRQENGDILRGVRTNSRGRDSYEVAKRAMPKQRIQFEHESDVYHSQDISVALYQREGNNLGYKDQQEKVEIPGPLFSQSHTVDDHSKRQESHTRKAVGRSRLGTRD